MSLNPVRSASVACAMVLISLSVAGCSSDVERSIEHYLRENEAEVPLLVTHVACDGPIAAKTVSCTVSFVDELELPDTVVTLTALETNFPAPFKFSHKRIDSYYGGHYQVSVYTSFEGKSLYRDEAGAALRAILGASFKAAVLKQGARYDEQLRKLKIKNSYNRD